MSRYADVLERTVWTAVQGGLAVWIVTAEFTVDAVKVAGVAALIAAVKGLLAFQVGAPTTAATLPAGPDTDTGGGSASSLGDRGAVTVEAVLLVVVLVVLVAVLL